MAVLRALAGPIKGAVFQLAQEDVTVGRQTSSQLCIGDPSVSRQHCIIQQSSDGFRIRDLGSNNGTFVNGKQVEECLLREGDRIRIGDTVLSYGTGGAPLPDNGVVANSSVQVSVSESAETAMSRLLDCVVKGSNFAAQAKSLLSIGASSYGLERPERMECEILRQILEVAPADQAAIVLLGGEADADPTVVGWTRDSRESAPVSVSRTLVDHAIKTGKAIFSDDISLAEEFREVNSLASRSVQSVIVAPLIGDGETIGAIYLESLDPMNPLRSEHLEFVVAVADYAGPLLFRAKHLRTLRESNQRLQSALGLKHGLVGRSLRMQEILKSIAIVARTDATVMICGETGTGKELVARAIHENSTRAGRPFEAINCSLLRDALLESELFGHEKGSFTGAVSQKKGKFELAEGGTLFLDELGALGESPQAMLLRVLQMREFQRLGGSRTLRANIRVIAATNEDLEEAVRRKTFRQDLFYRLNVVSIRMPPLRERREDIPLLASHFARISGRRNKHLITGVSTSAQAVLMRHNWPGNVRELENAIEHAVVFGATSEILPEDLPDALFETPVGQTGVAVGYHEAVLEAKKQIILSAIRDAAGDLNQAASRLGIHVNNLHRLIRDLKLKPILEDRQQ